MQILESPENSEQFRAEEGPSPGEASGVRDQDRQKGREQRDLGIPRRRNRPEKIPDPRRGDFLVLGGGLRKAREQEEERRRKRDGLRKPSGR